MEKLIPDTYSNLIGSVMLLIAIICLLSSIFKKEKSHTTRLFAIALVASLSLFSSHWTTYFAAIFIVATAVTELEFLQNLAAIIRKDENYFNYKRKAMSMSIEERLEKNQKEAIEEEYISNSPIDESSEKKSRIDLSKLPDLSQSEAIKLSLDVEEKALNLLSKTHGYIHRGVKFGKAGKSIEFDGILYNNIDRKNIIFEIKWTRNPKFLLRVIGHAIRQLKKQKERFEQITSLTPELNLVVVIDKKTNLSEDKIKQFEKQANEADIKISFFGLDEIGFDVIDEIPKSD